MAASQSRLPKAQRVARVLDQEPVPDPEDYFQSAKYIDRRAELGDFNAKGIPASVLPVLHYLWRHTVFTDDLPGEVRGWVLSGKSKLAKIATECNYSYDQARKALDWLAGNGWIWKLLDSKAGNNLSVKVLMDQEAHDSRTLCAENVGGMRCERTGYASTTQRVCAENADNTSTSTSISTTTSTSEGKSAAAEGRKKPRANMPEFSQVRQDVSSATSPRVVTEAPGSQDSRAAAKSSSAPEVDRAYTFWQKDGSWLVFPVSQAKFKPRDAQVVSLTVEEDEFYQEFFRGGKEKNAARREFLILSHDERTEGMQQVRAKSDTSEPEPDLQLIPVPDGVKIFGGPVKQATEKVAASGVNRNTGRYKHFRLRIEAWDKVGYVTPEDYKILADAYRLAA